MAGNCTQNARFLRPRGGGAVTGLGVRGRWHTDLVEVERGVYGPLPYAAIGAGPPLVVFAD
jgi:hypothetical protein